jgi:peptidoglycan DL-endopeptidase CwlO
VVGFRPLQLRSRGLLLLAAALAAGALLAGLLPAAGTAETAPDLPARAAELRHGQAALQRTEHGALLALYAAEASLGRARAEQARLEARSHALARQEASLRDRSATVQRSLTASQERVVRTLRELYIYGEVDPLAAVLGATSLDEALTAVDSLARATEQNRRLVVEASEKARRLHALVAVLGARRAALNEAREAAVQGTVRLEQATGEHRATVASIRARSARASARAGELLAQARAAEQASQQLAARAAAAEAVTAAEEGTPDDVSATPPAIAHGTRTLVVDVVAYHLPGMTASGLPVGVGVVAVDPNVIPLGTRMFIPGYGPGIAADVGSAIRGNIIDLWMPSTAAARRWGRRTVTITIYG